MAPAQLAFTLENGARQLAPFFSDLSMQRYDDALMVTEAGPLLGFVITGSFLTEYIFAIPGLGKYYVSSVTNRDYSVVMGLAVLLSAVIIVANLVVDIVYGILDPRIRYE